jgi:hypothetical protein
MSFKQKLRTWGMSQLSHRVFSQFSARHALMVGENRSVPFGFRLSRLWGLIAAIVILSSSSTEAASCYWNISSGNWSTAAYWGGTEPRIYDYAYIQNGGTATITQTGEGCSTLYLGTSGTGHSGTVEMIGGVLYVDYFEYIGYSGTGTFTQTGGTNTIAFSSSSAGLYLGYNSGSNGTYNLSGTGQLYTSYQVYEVIGISGTGTFTQTGGTNTATYIKIGTAGTYTLSAGILNLNGGFENQGILDLSNTSAVINASSSFLDLRSAIITNAENASLNIDTHSLLIVPSGFDPANYFAIYTNKGILHQAGSALDISSAYSIYGLGSIDDHVNCQGRLAATSGYAINLNGGLTVSGTGSVNLGSGTLYVNDAISGLSGGSLNAYNQYVGSTGTGTFSQTGGTNSNDYLYLGYNAGSSGTYNLSSGMNLTMYLYLGYNSGSIGMYNLSGTGKLSVAYDEYIGRSGTGTFTQTGGTNTAIYIKIGTAGTYTLSAGTLNINGGLENQGILDLSNSSAIINASSSIVDLSDAILTNAGNTSLNIDAHSLLIVPSGFDPANYFKSYANAGILHQAGSTLQISSSQTISGIGSINDHVDCQGTLTATSRYPINLNGGLTFSGAGSVNLRNGTLYVNDTSSGMSGGSLNALYQYIGSTGTGMFTQTGGTNSAQLYLGYNSGSNGTYNLSGTGQLLTNYYEYIGYSGVGTFTQTGGTNSTPSLSIGSNSGSSGTYNLSGTGKLSTPTEFIGFTGTGTFAQTGGINTISVYLYLGYNSGSTSTYNLSDGTLILKSLIKGSGTVHFNFGGGTLQASGNFTTTLPMTLTGDGGNANLDTAGYAVTLSGVLSGTGGLNKLGSGTLTLSAKETYAGDTTINGGTLAIAGGIDPNGTSLIDIQSGTAMFKTVNVSKLDLDINTAALATFEVLNGSHAVGAIAGSGITQVDAGASLTAQSISQGTLTLGIGARVTIQPIPGGPLGDTIAPVPEPASFVLLSGAFIVAIYVWARKRIRP